MKKKIQGHIIKTNDITKTFIVELWSRVFEFLNCFTPFNVSINILKKILKEKFSFYRYFFVEIWVLGHLILSVILFLLVVPTNFFWWKYIVIVYGGVRVYEIIIYQVDVLFFGEYRARKKNKQYALRGYRRLVILLLHNFIEIVFWFALFYRNINWVFDSCEIVNTSNFDYLNLSFYYLTTFSFSNTTLISNEFVFKIIVLLQSIIGLFMVLLLLAKFIALIPTPATMDDFE